MGTNESRPLRVGVLLDDAHAQRWIHRILDGIQAGSFAQLAVFVLNAERRPAPTSRPLHKRVLRPRPHLLYEVLDRQDARSNPAAVSAYVPRRDVRESFPDVPVLEVVPVRTRPWECRFDDGTLDELRAHDLDVILRFGFQVVRGGILDLPRYGLWSYHGGDSREYRGRPSFFWEIMERQPVSGSVLQILSDELDGGRVIYRSFTANDPSSLWRNRNATHWKNAEFALRRLRELHAFGFEHIAALPTYNEHVEYRKPIYRIPTNRDVLRFAARSAAHRWREKVRRRLSAETGFVAYRRRAGNDAFEDAGRFSAVRPPRGRSWSEPSLREVDGRAYVYVTDRALTGGPARITCFEIATDGPNPPFTAISTSEGVSHPFVFGHGGEAYMLVQTGDNAIALYRATRFPDQWSFEGTVLDGRPGRSPVLCFHDGRLWLFVNEAVRGGRYDDELHLYHADSLAGPWHPHPRNPIVSDVRHARPGGRPFVRGGALTRPARDASQPGRGTLTLQRVDRMTLDDYREQKVAELDPAWTKRNRVARAYDLSARFEVLDGAWLVPAARARA